MILNLNNYLNFFRIFFIFESPIKFIFYIIFKKFPSQICINTPIGPVKLNIRNYESLKTIFSIFCRQDYLVDEIKSHYIDIGANCGYSAIYFLSRNNLNTIDCYEPDEKNFFYLEQNLKSFKNRCYVNLLGVGPYKEKAKFYITDDGKYSSVIKNNTGIIKEIHLITLKQILDNTHNDRIIIKIDVEGIEKQIIQSIDFRNYKNIYKLIIESLDCKEVLNCNFTLKIVNGYVEHITLKS